MAALNHWHSIPIIALMLLATSTPIRGQQINQSGYAFFFNNPNRNPAASNALETSYFDMPAAKPDLDFETPLQQGVADINISLPE